jgi:acyl carrier protein
MAEIVAFERFCKLFGREFDIEPDALRQDTLLSSLLRLDSFELLRIAIFLESLTPVDLPDAVDPNTLTVGHLYNVYAVAATQEFG